MTSAEAIRSVSDRIAERSDGNPGAINVMCMGVAEVGPEFMLALELAELRGPDIWRVYKDKYDCDIEKMFKHVTEDLVR